MAIAELSAIASNLTAPDSKVPKEFISAANASFMKIISYLKELNKIGKGNARTTQNIPDINDLQNITSTGLIDNQLFVDSLAALLRISNPPKIVKQEETNE
jgi:hypothetical protein